MIKIRAFLLVTMLCAVSLAAEAPDLKTILDKNAESAGGRAALDAVKSFSMIATVKMPAQNLSGKMQFDRKPDAVRIQIELPGVGLVQYGLLGDIAYESTDLMGARLLGEEEKRQMLDGLDPQTDVKRLTRLTDTAITEDAGNWKLEGKNEKSVSETYWFDQKTFQLVKSRFPVSHQMGTMVADAAYSDFKTIGGIIMPTKIRQNVGPMEMVVEVGEVKVNPELPEAIFKLPTSVQRLVDKRSSTTTQPAVQQ